MGKIKDEEILRLEANQKGELGDFLKETALNPDLVPNTYTQWEDKSDPLVPTATLQIYDYIASTMKRTPDTHINRASSATMCPKRRWYQGRGVEGEVLTPRKIVNFLLGDLTEYVVRHFIHEGCVGPGKLYSEVDFGVETGQFTVQGGKVIKLYSQPDLVAKLGSINVTAHVDGWGKRNSDGQWELIEIKSAASYGYDRFKEEGPGDYLKQAMVNLQTDRAIELDAKQVRFFYLRKDTGELWSSVWDYDDTLAEAVRSEYELAQAEQEPEAPYGDVSETFRGKPTGKTKLVWQCGYCPYKSTCKPDYKLEFKSGKPVYYKS